MTMTTALTQNATEEITHEGRLYGIVIRASFKKEGIHFFTPPEFSQQLGYMNRPKGYKVEAHTHKPVPRSISLTQEVLFLRAGKIRVSFFDHQGNPVTECILSSGDTILLAEGGHAVEMLEASELIEVKQGPYQNDDKIFLTPADDRSC